MSDDRKGNIHKENTYTHLGEWCEKYFKDHGLKVHPTSVPIDLVLEDVMGYVAILNAHDKTHVMVYDQLSKRVEGLELLLNNLLSQFNELVRALHEKEEAKEVAVKPPTKKAKK